MVDCRDKRKCKNERFQGSGGGRPKILTSPPGAFALEKRGATRPNPDRFIGGLKIGGVDDDVFMERPNTIR